MNDIYKRIEYLIKLHNLTKSKFSADTGISTGNLGDWKRGKALPGAQALMTIAEYFQVSLDWLLTGKGDPHCCVGKSDHEVDELVQRVLDMSKEEREEVKLLLDFLKYRRERSSNVANP